MATEKILNTSIEWDDVERMFSEKFGIECRTGERRKTKIVGEKNGFFSILILIEADWIQPSGNLPNEFILKIFKNVSEFVEEKVENRKNTEMIGRLLEPHNAEVFAYDLFNKYGDNLLKRPQVFGGRTISISDYEKPFLLMENLGHLNAGHILETDSTEEMEMILPSIVAMNKISRMISEEERNSLERKMFSRRFCLQLYPDEEKRMYIEMICGLEIPGIEEAAKKLAEIHGKITDLAMFKEIDDTSEDLGMEPLTVHGDLWSSNLMWSDGKEKREFGAIIDFQYFALSTPAVDLVALFVSCLGGKERRKSTQRLLEKYWENVKEQFETPLPFSFSQLLDSFYRVFPFIAFDVLGILAYVFKNHPENIKNKKEVEEKLIFLIEDIVAIFRKYHRPASDNS